MKNKTCGKCKYSFGNSSKAKFCSKLDNKVVTSYQRGCGYFAEEVPIIGVFEAECRDCSSEGVYIEFDNIKKDDTLRVSMYSDFDNIVLSREDAERMAKAIFEHYNKLDEKGYEDKEDIDF